MTKVMEKLGLPIPPFVLRQHIVINVETQEQGRHRITVTWVDSDGTPMTFLQLVRLEGTRRITRAEPFTIHVRELLEFGT